MAPSASAGAGSARLNAGERLTSGERLVSPNGMALTMQADGNLVLTAPSGSVRWNSGTYDNPGAFAQMQGDGNFVVYSAAIVPLWNSQTNGTAASFVQVQDDGNLVVYDASSRWYWQSGTRYFPSRVYAPVILSSGTGLQSPNGAYEAILQTDGNFVLYGPTGAMWSSQTQGTGANQLALQGDGNLVLYAGSRAVWNTQTFGSAGFLQLQDDGNLVLYDQSVRATWNTATYPGGSGGQTIGQRVVAYAERQIGKPYVYGAEGPDAFDCSGLTQQAWASVGVAIPRTANGQYQSLTKVAYAQRRPGDILAWGGSTVTHVAIYVGQDRMIEAPKPDTVVRLVPVYPVNLKPYVLRPAG